MAVKQFKTAALDKKVITFKIDDEEYRFAPRKVAKMFLPVLGFGDENEDTEFATIRAQFQWVMDGLDQPSKDRLMERLNDDDDGLDIDTVASIGEWLTEKVGGNPTG